MKQNTNDKTQIKYKQISPSEAKKKLETDKSIVLLNMRKKGRICLKSYSGKYTDTG